MLVPGLLVPVPGLAVAGAVVVAGGLGAAAGLAPVSTLWRSRLVSAEVVALAAWLGLAVVGHAHKIVPFIAYTALRARGVSHHPTGGPLLFSHLFDARLARVALVGAAGGFGALLVGVLVASPPAIAAGGLTLAVTGVLSTVNLVVGPVAVVRAAARPSPQTPRLEGGTCR